jgi:hypothetical protein
MTTEVDKTIEVDVPVTTAYNQWTQFESFPEFMGGVTEVRQLSDTRLHWVAEIAGVKREWEAEITDQVPDTRIAWRATEGATNAGAVSFSSVSATTTLVTLHLEYEPEGLLEKAGDKLNIVGKQAEGDLDRFKKFIEKQGSEEGGWRGSVAGSPATPGVEDAASSLGDDGKAGVSGKAVAAGVAAVVGAAAAGLAAKKAGSDDSEDEVDVTPGARHHDDRRDRDRGHHPQLRGAGPRDRPAGRADRHAGPRPVHGRPRRRDRPRPGLTHRAPGPARTTSTHDGGSPHGGCRRRRVRGSALGAVRRLLALGGVDVLGGDDGEAGLDLRLGLLAVQLGHGLLHAHATDVGGLLGDERLDGALP